MDGGFRPSGSARTNTNTCRSYGAWLHLTRIFDGGGLSSSVRSAMFIATTTADAQASSVGAAWMGDFGLLAVRERTRIHAAPTELGCTLHASSTAAACPAPLGAPCL